MSIRSWGRHAAVGGLVAVFQTWMKTLQFRVLYQEPSIDPMSPECVEPHLYIFWHEYILFPLYLRGHCHLTMLLSRHRDADWLTLAAKRLGFDFVRGSTQRGGTQALRSLMAAGKTRHLTITPDGPRGPRRRMAPGAIYLASRLNMPIVMMGFGYDRPWRLKSWDRFAIPRPFSRARAVISAAWLVPPGLDRAGVEEYRVHAEAELNRLTEQAEAWARTGNRLPGERSLFRQAAHHSLCGTHQIKPAVHPDAMLPDSQPNHHPTETTQAIYKVPA